MRERFECRPFWFFLISCFWCLFYHIACKKKCLLTNRYIWQQWVITHYAPGAVLGTRKLIWEVSEVSSDSQEFVLLPSAYMTKWPQVFSSCPSFAIRESSSQTSCTFLTGWFQSDFICSKVETFISYIPSARLLNLPWRICLSVHANAEMKQ